MAIRGAHIKIGCAVQDNVAVLNRWLLDLGMAVVSRSCRLSGGGWLRDGRRLFNVAGSKRLAGLALLFFRRWYSGLGNVNRTDTMRWHNGRNGGSRDGSRRGNLSVACGKDLAPHRARHL